MKKKNVKIGLKLFYWIIYLRRNSKRASQ